MNKYSEITSYLIGSLGMMAVIVPFLIEYIKNLIGTKKIYNVEQLSALIAIIVGIVYYVFFNILFPNKFTQINVLQNIVIGFIFSVLNAIGVQVGYDKLVKWLTKAILNKSE